MNPKYYQVELTIGLKDHDVSKARRCRAIPKPPKHTAWSFLSAVYAFVMEKRFLKVSRATRASILTISMESG